MAIETTRLGNSDLDVSRIGLGCMSLSGVYGASDDEASIRLIQFAIDQGVTFFDSADMYGWGHNETLLGRALAGRRDGVVIATKFGQVRRPDGSNGVDGRPEYVVAACDASLKRLGIETIDLYYQHRVDPNVPIEETVGAMAELVKAGKVREPVKEFKDGCQAVSNVHASDNSIEPQIPARARQRRFEAQ
jgi:aryl-alcohol dehydrogenase-like predicted oxidoreductase